MIRALAAAEKNTRSATAQPPEQHTLVIIHSQAPTRVDLAGGTLDIWPLYLFHKNSQTINFAVNYPAVCRLMPRRDSAIEIISHDQNRRELFASLDALSAAKRFQLPLPARLLIAFEPAGGLTLETEAQAPAGAGLGGSSALNIAICGALARHTGKKRTPAKLVELARNVEAQVLGVPTGEQDYYSAVRGGVQAIHLEPHGVRPEQLNVPEAELSARIVLCYTGQSRNSGINNWEVMKAHLDGNQKVIRQFDSIASIAEDMRQALLEREWRQAARLLEQDWKTRKKNYPGITTARIDELIAAAARNGSRAAKVCGAGGGGCVVFLVDPEAKSRVEAALLQQDVRVLPLEVNRHGLRVRTSGR